MTKSAATAHSKILILDFGSQYTQVIARRIRECQVYSEIVQFNISAEEVAELAPQGIILSGGPGSVYDQRAPHPGPKIFSLGIPVLGICYGMQLMAHHLGGKVEFSERREHGAGMLQISQEARLFDGIGDQLTCIFVNNGLLRSREEEMVQRVFEENFHIRLKYVDAADRFLKLLEGVTDPEEKRKIIGREFVKVFEHATEELLAEDAASGSGGHGGYHFLAQGTLYPDVIESVAIGGNPAHVIKSHHNVGGLPEKMHFELVEPVRQLFKDEVRQAGLQLGLPKEVVYRQPFPGPGLAVRILGEVTPERLRILRDADTIVQSEMEASDWYYRVWQSFAVLLPVQSVGVMGDQRTYDYTIALRIVESQDGMTADWVRLPYDLLARISNRIVSEVKGVNRVVLDISTKPPSTIEWE